MYKIKSAWQSALVEIVRNMELDGFTVEDAKQKIKSLRATYNEECNNIAKSTISGSGADNVYKPQIEWSW